MADSDGDKTEAPTPKRRQEARDQGRIAKSSDLTAALLLMGITILLGATGGRILTALRELLAGALSGDIRVRSDEDVLSTLAAVFGRLGIAMLPLLSGTLLLAILANWLQVGFHPSLKKVTPKLSNFSPIKGVKRLFGSGQGPVKFIMGILKMFLVGFVAYTAVHGKMEIILGMAAAESVLGIFTVAAGLVYDITLRIGITLFILALLDFAYQKWKTEKEMKMTKQEVKEEMKRMDGDPKIKARRRQIQMQQAMKRMQTEVPKADVIVTNPTHFAVALKYDKDAMHAPRVVAKGTDLLALKIREIAAAHGIPIIERPPLARALHKMCEIGDEIPEQFYAAVAEILAYVYELTGRSQRKVPA